MLIMPTLEDSIRTAIYTLMLIMYKELILVTHQRLLCLWTVTGIYSLSPQHIDGIQMELNIYIILATATPFLWMGIPEPTSH